jgi:hypothetical protein
LFLVAVLRLGDAVFGGLTAPDDLVGLRVDEVNGENAKQARNTLGVGDEAVGTDDGAGEESSSANGSDDGAADHDATHWAPTAPSAVVAPGAAAESVAGVGGDLILLLIGNEGIADEEVGGLAGGDFDEAVRGESTLDVARNKLVEEVDGLEIGRPGEGFVAGEVCLLGPVDADVLRVGSGEGEGGDEGEGEGAESSGERHGASCSGERAAAACAGL